jgi:hypothetical protein
MPTIRAKTTDVLAQVTATLRQEAAAAAGTNDLVSRDEQRALAPDLQAAANDVRTAGGPGSRVAVDALVAEASSKVAALLGQVNQPSGSGAALVSADEVRALAALDPAAGARVARGYELITGRRVELPVGGPGAPPVVTPPVVTPARAVALANAALTAATPFKTKAAIVGDQLQLDLRLGAPATFAVDVGGHPVRLSFAQRHVSHTGGVGLVNVQDIIEGMRQALPNHDVRVASFVRGEAVVDVWPRGAVPAQSRPVYALAELSMPVVGFEFEMSGPLALKAGTQRTPAGTTLSFRVDDKVYTSTARGQADTTYTLAADVKRALESDGRSVDLRRYSNFFTMRVTG